MKCQEEGNLNRASLGHSSHQEYKFTVKGKQFLLYWQSELKLHSPNKWHLLSTT